MTIATLLTSVTIILVPVGGMLGHSGLKCGTYGGIYDVRTETIYLCQQVEGDETFYKYHELGHHFWFKYMTQKQRDEYTKEFNKSKVFYRDYGSTSVIEDFAENFAVHALKMKHDKALGKRMFLIRKYLR